MALTKISGEVIQSGINIGIVTASTINVGSAVTIHTGGFQVGTSDLHSTGITVKNVNSTGIITATSFVGSLTGNVTGNVVGNATGLSNTPNITVGSIIASSAVISGNVSVAGTVTYEDVTNVDSVGVVTARSGVHVTSGNLLIGTTNSTGTASQPLQVTGGAYVSGNLGISTITPEVNLDVYGSDTVIRTTDSGTGVQWRGRIVARNTNAVVNASVFMGVYNTNACVASHNSTLNEWKSLYVNTTDGITNGANVIVAGSGNVGVGLTTPSEKFQVAGNIRQSGSTINNSGGTILRQSGSIIQVVRNTITTAYSLTATTETVIYNPMLTITPTNSNSLIFFDIQFFGYHNPNNDFYTSLWVRRNSVGTAISSTPNTTWGDWTRNFGSMVATSAHADYHFSCWDLPGTTSAVNYLLTGKNHQASRTFELWHAPGAGNMRITAFEIAQ